MYFTYIGKGNKNCTGFSHPGNNPNCRKRKRKKVRCIRKYNFFHRRQSPKVNYGPVGVTYDRNDWDERKGH